MIAALALVLQVRSLSYADSATAALIARAMAQHRQLDAAVLGYRATIRTRVDAGIGFGRHARVLPFAVVEQESDFSWETPNDIRIVTRGQRSRTAFPTANVEARWTRPWFIPRFLGDSVRLLDQDLLNRAAVHPLAAGACGSIRRAPAAATACGRTGAGPPSGVPAT